MPDALPHPESGVEQEGPDPRLETLDAEPSAASEPSPPPSLLRKAAPVQGTVLRGRMQAAWLRSILSQIESSVSQDDGWQVLEMKLDNGDGTMTIKARRDADRMSIAVGFSDPQLRSMALANEDRLRQALQQRYETNIDLSLDSKSQDRPAGREASPPPASTSSSTRGGTVTNGAAEPVAAARAIHAGAKHVWVG